MAALFKLYLFIWTMLSYNWVDRNLYSVAYNKNAETIDSDELEDYIYSRWHKKVPKPILKKTSGIVIKRDQTIWKNMPNKKHTPWVMLKSDMIRHNGDGDDYMLHDSSDNDEDDMSGEEEEDEDESMHYDHSRNGDKNHYNGDNNHYNGDNNHDNGDDLKSHYLLRQKIYKDIDKLTQKCSLPLNSKCLSTVFYYVFKNLVKHKRNKKNVTLKSKEQNALMHQNPYPLKYLQQLLEDIFLKKYAFLPQSLNEYSSENHYDNSSSSSEEERNNLLLKLISLTHKGNADISKILSTNSNEAKLDKQTKDRDVQQSSAVSSAKVSIEQPQSVTYKSTKSKWKMINNYSGSGWKNPEIKISFNGNELNMSENTYLGLEYFYKLIGILNDLKINFTYSPDKKAIFINPESLLTTRMHGNFLNIKDFGWQKRKPLKVQIDFNKNTAKGSHIILKTGKSNKNDSDSSEIKIEILHNVKNMTAEPNVIDVQGKTLFSPQPNIMSITTMPPPTQPPPPTTPQPPPPPTTPQPPPPTTTTQPPPPTTTQPPPPTTTQPPPTTTTITTTNRSPMDVNININVNDRYVNNSLTAGRKKDINITHIHTHPNNAYGNIHPTVSPISHLGEWTVWYKWSQCSTSCGIGHRKRHRICLPPGFFCPGNHSEKASCLKRHCDLGTTPHVGHLTSWTPWSECSTTCNMGHKNRQRVCLPKGYHCKGNITEEIFCKKISCDVAITTTKLSTTTTTAMTTTTTTTKRVAIVKSFIPLGHWTIWQEWSRCSSSCGLGIRKRTRVCLPYGFHCNGDLLEMASCMLQTCDSVKRTMAKPPTTKHTVIMITVKPPTIIVKPPTIAVRPPITRQTIIAVKPPITKQTIIEKPTIITVKLPTTKETTIAKQTITAKLTTTTKEQTTAKLLSKGKIKPTTTKLTTMFSFGKWQNWQEWSACSVSCGYGIQRRERSCPNSHCIGFSTETVQCMERHCKPEQHAIAVDGSAKEQWSSWTEWSDCSTKCGPGQQTRYHSCLPNRPCTDHRIDVKTCNLGSCFAALTLKTTGHWTSWSDWSHCSKTCSRGHRRRFRSCLPKGTECKGFNIGLRDCMISHCHKVLPIKTPGSWTSWNEWSHCSTTCGLGFRKRFHKCLPKGSECHGNTIEMDDCINRHCVSGLLNKTNGHWMPWSEWSLCSATCDKGLRSRFRTCSTKASRCHGEVIDVIRCMTKSCDTEISNKTLSHWTSWSEWSHCSTTCDSGQRERFRICLPTGSKCQGNQTEKDECMHKLCDTDLQNSSWTSWSEWSSCSTTCDLGQRRRFRSCIPKGSECQGNVTEEDECMHKPCDTELSNYTDSSWTSWSEWSHCSTTCDSGERRRFRSCIPKGSKCLGNFSEEDECMHQPCDTELTNKTHSSWTSWSEWSSCSTTCDSGERRRFRSCLPKGNKCRGNITEEDECMHQPCDTELTNMKHSSWTSWSEWSSCSTTCDSGERRRFRSCLPKGNKCEGDVTEEEDCMHQPCDTELTNKTHSSWTSWSEWSSCSTTCDSGERRRFRRCLPKGSKCKGDVTEEDDCMHQPCHRELTNMKQSSWTSWSEWSSCSTTCDSGLRRRYRSCLPKGIKCQGAVTEKDECMYKPCHRELTNMKQSSWTSWSEWSSCSTTCDSGLRRRYRSCLPKGSKCQGDVTEEDDCMHQPCHREPLYNTDSSWTSWSEWSHCSTTCDSGHRKRFRSCLPKGNKCHGNVTEEEECRHKSCHIEYLKIEQGEWDEWKNWAPCSTSCGNGRQRRHRICLPIKSHCHGNRKEVKSCMERNCTQEKFVATGGLWTQWTRWSNCSADCGSGQQKRKRTCYPSGYQCVGDMSNVQLCMKRTCFPGQWSNWGDWSKCSAECGSGQITKNRTCIPIGGQCLGNHTEHTTCMQKSCDKENILKPTSVLQGKFTKLKCCSRRNCHRSKYKWLKPDGTLILPSNSSGNRFFAVNEYLIIEKTQKKDKGIYRCLKIDGNSAKGNQLSLDVHTCENKPCLNKGVCEDTIFSPKRLYRTVCKCPADYFGSVCQVDKTSPFSSKLAIMLAIILIILFCVLLVILLVYFCYRRGKLKRCFDSKMNVLLEFNHDNTFNSSDDKSGCPGHTGLSKTQFYSPETFYPDSIIHTTTIDAVTEDTDWNRKKNPTPS